MRSYGFETNQANCEDRDTTAPCSRKLYITHHSLSKQPSGMRIEVFLAAINRELDMAGSREGPVASWQSDGDEPLGSEIQYQHSVSEIVHVL